MPISSGALEWPKSYFRKPEVDNEGEIDNKISARSGTTRDYEWQLQLSNRDDYEKWRRETERKVPVKKKKTKKDTCGCCPCCNKQKTKVQRVHDETIANRKKPRDAIKLHRRWCCCCLAFWLSLLFLAILILFIFFFLYYTGQELLIPMPPPGINCTGHWHIYFQTLNVGLATTFAVVVTSLLTTSRI